MAEPYFGSSNSNGNMQMDYITRSPSLPLSLYNL
jgi:hypothetical protein